MTPSIGQRFGRLTVIGRAPCLPGNKNPRWLCECDCGGNATPVQWSLVNGRHRSCGCLRNEKTLERLRAHNASHPSRYAGHYAEYMSWKSMRARCLNPKTTTYENYGGRGITICDRWVGSFENFLADMGARPHGTSIDRIDVNGNYEPGNCRWATHLEQQNNRRPPRPRKVSAEVREQIIALSNAGLMYIEIAPRFGISKSRVGQIVREARATFSHKEAEAFIRRARGR